MSSPTTKRLSRYEHAKKSGRMASSPSNHTIPSDVGIPPLQESGVLHLKRDLLKESPVSPRLEGSRQVASPLSPSLEGSTQTVSPKLGRKKTLRLSVRASLGVLAAQESLQSEDSFLDMDSHSAEWIFGAWGLMVSLFSSVFGLICGSIGLVYSHRAAEDLPAVLQPWYHSTLYYICHVTCIVFSICILSTVFISPLHRSGYRAWTIIRPILFLIVSLVCATSFFTFIPAILFAISCFLFAISVIRQEKGSLRLFDSLPHVHFLSIVRRWLYKEPSESGNSRSNNLKTWWIWHSARGAWARLLIKLIWAGINAALFASHYISARQLVLDTASDSHSKCALAFEEVPFSECMALADNMLTFLPIAKGFGFCLDFNCALIVLFITQSVIRKMNAACHHSKLSVVLGWFPVSRTLSFHKHIAAAIFVFTCGHVFGHMMSHSYLLIIVSRTVPFNGVLNHLHNQYIMLSVWATGILLLGLLVFMYATASAPIRGVKYNHFRHAHIICALSFYAVLFWHAEVFVYYGGIPVLLYLIDVALRSRHSKVRLMEAKYSHPVLQLVFPIPFPYKSGMYAQLRCPLLEGRRGTEWHPFTISSAYESNTVTFHIKCYAGGWTEKIRECVKETALMARKHDWCSIVSDADNFHYVFSARDWVTKRTVPGLPNWGEKPLFTIDGPHAAPAMQYDRFDTILLIGGGIGLTPMNSILSHLACYSWRTPKEITTKSTYGVWMCRHAELPAYRWFMDSLSDCEVGVQLDINRHYEMHLFVTSFQGELSTKEMNCSRKTILHQSGVDPVEVTRPYTGEDLLSAALNPSASSSDFPDSRNKLGKTQIWAGRPQWEAIFERIQRRHGAEFTRPGAPFKRHRVGVFFVGSPDAVQDIQRVAQAFTTHNISFQVMKEYF